MKDTIFEINQEATRENITFHFQPNEQFNSIKEAIVRKCHNNRRRTPVASPSHLHQHHIGGLPSPPVEEKKVLPVPPEPRQPTPPPSSPPPLSSTEIKEKIQSLKDEKHRLFQLIKKMMVEEDNKRKQEKSEAENIKKQTTQTPKPVQSNKKKSRWGAPATDTPASPYNNSYFCPRPPLPRYNNGHPYMNQRPRQQQQQQQQEQHHYSLSRPPYSR